MSFGINGIQDFCCFADKLGFKVTFIDSRQEIIDRVNKEKFTCICEEYETAVEKLAYNSKTFITIMTHAHNFDQLLTE